jgi:S-DNA-T family DNA segregation ATPase FtsK/SpoIIIE
VDSRVILDTVGAEKLLGKGDTLLLTSDSPKARRVQGTFMDDREIEKLVEFWKGQSGPPLPVIPLDGQEDADNSRNGDAQDEDDILDKARALAERHQQLSASVLQRRLQIGYSRAMQLMEILEDEGSISRSGAPAGKSRKGAAPF